MEEVKMWADKMKLLEEFVNINGRLPFSTETFKDEKIGRWLADQRYRYNIGILSPVRTERLNNFNPYWMNKEIFYFEHIYEKVNKSKYVWKHNVPKGKTSLQGVLEVEPLFDSINHGIYDCESYIERNKKKAKTYEMNLYRCYAKVLKINVNYLILLSRIYGAENEEDVISWYKSLGFKSKKEMENFVDSKLKLIKRSYAILLRLRSGFGVKKPLTLDEASEIFRTRDLQCDRRAMHYREKVALQQIRETLVLSKAA